MQTSRVSKTVQNAIRYRFSLDVQSAYWFKLFSTIVLIALGGVLCLPYLDLPLHTDSAVYAHAAYWWMHGDTLYRNFTITRPQGIFVVFGLIEAIGLGSIRGIHFAAGITIVLCALLLLKIAAMVWGRAVGFGAAVLFVLMMGTPDLEGFTANAELFMLLPVLGSLYLLLQSDQFSLDSRRGRLLLIGCGLLAAIGLLVKPAGVVSLPLAALWLLRRQWHDKLGWWQWFRGEAILGISFLLGLLPALLHGLLTVPDIYLYVILLYRLGNDSLAANPLLYQLSIFGQRSLGLVIRLPIVLIVPVGFHVSHSMSAGNARGRDLLWLWTITSLGGTAMGGNWYPHYYQQLLPPLTVAVSLGLHTLLRSSVRYSRLRFFGQGMAVAGLLALAIGTAIVLASPADPIKLILPSTPATFAPREVIDPVVAYLIEHTAETDTIYVAYQQTDIYYLAHRQSAGRWPDFPDLAHIPGAFDEQVALLADPVTAPRYIVAAQPFDALGFDPQGKLRAVVARDYTLETTIGDIPLYRRNR